MWNWRQLGSKQRLTDSDSRTDSTLPLLHPQVRQQHAEHVLRSDRLGDVSERVDGRTSDALLVRLEEVQQLEADSHPLSRRDELGSSVGLKTEGDSDSAKEEKIEWTTHRFDRSS